MRLLYTVLLARVGAKVVGSLVAVPVVCGAAGVALVAVTVAAPIYGVYRLVRRVSRSSSDDDETPSAVSSDVDEASYDTHWELDLPPLTDPVWFTDVDSVLDYLPARRRTHDDAESDEDPYQHPPSPPPPVPRRNYYNFVRRAPPDVPSVDDDGDVSTQRAAASPDHQPLDPDPPSVPPPAERRVRAAVESSRLSLHPAEPAALDRGVDVTDSGVDTELAAEPPALPARLPRRSTGSTASPRRRPPAVPPPSHRHDVAVVGDDSQHSSSSSRHSTVAAETASDSVEVTHL